MRNVTRFGEFADQYDMLVAYDEKLLAAWVEEQKYSTGSMILASTALASAQFAQSFTDLGRLGNGLFVEGGWKGAGKDVLRAVSIAGSVGAVLGRGGTAFRLVQQVESGLCTYVAQANALRRTGHRLLITAEELIKKTGGNAERIWGYGAGTEEYLGLLKWMDDVRLPYQVVLRASSGGERSLQAVESVIRATKGVVTFGIKATGQLSKAGEVASRDHLIHRMYAMYSRTRGLEIRNPLGPVFRSVRELSAHYRDLQLSSGPVIALRNSALVTASHTAQTVTEAAMALKEIAFHVLPFLRVPAGDAQTAAQVLIINDQYSRPSVKPDPINRHSVSSGDTLSGLALRYYGAAGKWPLIYAANRDGVGSNPDVIKPGQNLIIPEQPAIATAKEAPKLHVAPAR